MNLEDFKIGEAFYTGSGKWICIDIGTRSVIAIKEECAFLKLQSTYGITNPTANLITHNYHDILHHMVFWEMDFGGCSKDSKRF